MAWWNSFFATISMEFLYYLTFLCIVGIGHGEVDQRFLNFEKCLANGKLFGRHSDNVTHKTIYNFRYNIIFEKTYPIAIFTPASINEVQRAVKCGVRSNIQLVPISGGHSYAGLSAGQNDSILIDFRLMNKISINSDEKTVTVESGVVLGKLYFYLWNNGGFGVPLGACTTVAMGGLAIGGGIGYFSSHFGLAIDNLVEINMVDASGNDIIVDQNRNVDLWWAMRGVGPGYIGIVTSVKLKMFDATNLQLASLMIRFDNRHFKKVMESYIKWLDWVKENDPSINTVMVTQSDEYKSNAACGSPDVSGTSIKILQFRDSKTSNERLNFIKAALDIFEDFHSFDLSFPNFIEYFDKVSYTTSEGYCETETIDEKLDFFSSFTRERNKPSYFLSRSFFVKKPYTAESFNEAQNILLNIPANGCGVYINSEQGTIHHHQSNETAYVHRDALFSFKVYVKTGNEADVKPCIDWMNSFYDSVEFMDSGATFQNYPQRTMEDYLQRYYGNNLERLIDIKNKWDPNHYFNSEQSLPSRLTIQKLMLNFPKN